MLHLKNLTGDHLHFADFISHCISYLYKDQLKGFEAALKRLFCKMDANEWLNTSEITGMNHEHELIQETALRWAFWFLVCCELHSHGTVQRKPLLSPLFSSLIPPPPLSFAIGGSCLCLS